MSEENSLMDLFEDMDFPALINECHRIYLRKRDISVVEVLSILEQTVDLELITALIEALMIRLDDVDEALMIHFKQSSEVVRNHIVMVLANGKRSKHMQFLLDIYFYNPYMRPAIRQHAFGDKKFLFMNLARYFEDSPFNEDTVNIAQQILKTISRDVILSCKGIFNGTKILDLYYALPVDEREKFDD